MDAAVLQAVVPELREALVGHPVTGVRQIGRFGVLIRFGGCRQALYLSAHPELSRIGLVGEPPAIGEERPGPDNLVQPLKGATLESIRLEPNGRVVELRLDKRASEHGSPALVAELIPRFANVILLGNDGRILWAKRTFDGTRVRPVAPGRRYEKPATETGVPFAALTEPILRERLEAAEDPGDRPVWRRIPRAWGGGANGHAKVFADAGLDPVERLLALAEASRVPAPRLARRLAAESVAGNESDQESEVLHLFPADPGELPGWELLPSAGPSETLDRFLRDREESEESGLLLGDLRRTLVRRRTRAAKALRKIQERASEAARESEIRRQAELLAANLGTVRRGMSEIRVTDFDGSPGVVIALDPKLAPKKNLDALFKKARRLARSLDQLESQRSIQEEEISRVDAALAALDPCPAPDLLGELVREHAPALLRSRERAGSAGATPPAKSGPGEEERPASLPEGFHPRRYVLPGGWEVWVGRSAKQNDELTHRWAKSRDLWFHARGCEGSHAVLRVDSGKGEPPKEIVLAAAAIAAHHSKARRSSLVPVAYTEKRYVRKPRGAPVGTASMMREKVVLVEPGVPEGS